MVMPSRSVDYTLVNGEVTWERGAMTGVIAGQVLRSRAALSGSGRRTRNSGSRQTGLRNGRRHYC
jgi:hypothetical protein